MDTQSRSTVQQVLMPVVVVQQVVSLPHIDPYLVILGGVGPGLGTSKPHKLWGRDVLLHV